MTKKELEELNKYLPWKTEETEETTFETEDNGDGPSGQYEFLEEAYCRGIISEEEAYRRGIISEEEYDRY